MANDALMPRFLYTMLKQLDLKSIDWNIVSRELNITNGHAARMRYSRFKQQMEGKATTPRRSKPANGKPRAKKGAGDPKSEASTDPFTDNKSNIKHEDGTGSAAATPSSERLSQMDISRDVQGSPGVEEFSPTHNSNQAVNMNTGMNMDTDQAASAHRRIKSEPRDDDPAIHSSFTPPMQQDSQETDADADADASYELVDMQAHAAHTDALLGTHSSNTASFSTSAHHSFGNPSQDSMMSFSSNGSGGPGMYSYVHTHAHAHGHAHAQPRSSPRPGLMTHGHANIQAQPQTHGGMMGERAEFGGYMPVIMPSYGDAGMGGGHAMGMGMGMGVGVGVPGSNAGPYPQAGMMASQNRQGLKLEERWDDSYCA